jgi:carbon-monoxide dehydrogenase medium subunit
LTGPPYQRQSAFQRDPRGGETLQVPAPFAYERATSVDHALALLEELGPEARLLAGGHSLLPMMKLRLAQPEHLIDIDPLASELGYVEDRGDALHIGAMTRHRALLDSPLLRETIFTDAEQVIADPVVRNRGTIGGALCQADPSEDLSAVCAAVDAQLVIRSSRAERVVDMHAFSLGPYATAVGPAEMLVEIRVPKRGGSAYAKVDRRVGDWAVAAVGAALDLDEDGAITYAGIALTAVGGGVTVTHDLVGANLKPPGTFDFAEAFRRAAQAAAEQCEPVTDQRGSEEYKRHVVGVLCERALQRAYARAQSSREV